MISVDVRALVRAVVDAVKADADLRRELAAALEIDRVAKHLTVAQYAAAHGLSESGVRKAIRAGRLKAVRQGRAVRIACDAKIAAIADAKLECAERKLGLVRGGGR